jgi:hypothetical protein
VAPIAYLPTSFENTYNELLNYKDLLEPLMIQLTTVLEEERLQKLEEERLERIEKEKKIRRE